MKKIILAAAIVAFVFLYSCNNNNSSFGSHPFAGTFVTADGFIFELRADSTTHITFSDSVTYSGTWKSRKAEDGLEYANIEFGGIQEFFYLWKEKLYRSEREMRHNVFGTTVTYRE
ncbi:hypothetical protein LJC21_01210 [Bacteroides sp. OttesenSCG-928-E20]|nr:hypothetical protein [Bacteroides sp. OttesenSCG-928-N06]MDL2299306.1 hypothetical protein [Bacteroides sp. OttesenSCG-928-E20]